MASQYLTAAREYPASDAPFRAAETMGPQPHAHNYLDAVRMNWRRTPEATYPDGYLGTVPSRRGDRLLDGLKARTNNRPYTRGVHKGERMDQRDYFWSEEMHPMAGIIRQATTGERWVPPGVLEYLPDERYPTDRRVGPRGVAVGNRYSEGGGPSAEEDAERKLLLRSQAPGWASGIRGNPGMAVHTRGGAG